jgi:acetyl-CoA C-acetyltransferase
VHFAAQAMMSGVHDVVIAGGLQTMTQIPISSAMTAASRSVSRSVLGLEGWVERYGNARSQFNPRR